MIAASAGLIAILDGNQFYMAELYTFTLADGTVLRYSAADYSILGPGAVAYPQSGLKFDRLAMNVTGGLQVGEQSVMVYADPADAAATMKGQAFAAFVRGGGLDGASLSIDRAFMAVAGDASNGLINIFMGDVGAASAGRTKVVLTVKDPRNRLNINMPRRVYQPGCLNTLFDAGCTLTKATFKVVGTVGASPSASAIPSALGNPAGYFDLGTLEFQSGALAGARRSVKTWAAGVFTPLAPFGSAPAPGDTFWAYPGCDKLQATCSGKFANLANFEGFPYIPVPETAQ